MDSDQMKRIKREIRALGRICSGTLLERTKVCGKPNCRCATDPDQRHGPYLEWNRREDGALRHHNVTPKQAAAIRAAIENYQRLIALLAAWEKDSVDAILGAQNQPRKGSNRKIGSKPP